MLTLHHIPSPPPGNSQSTEERCNYVQCCQPSARRHLSAQHRHVIISQLQAGVSEAESWYGGRCECWVVGSGWHCGIPSQLILCLSPGLASTQRGCSGCSQRRGGGGCNRLSGLGSHLARQSWAVRGCWERKYGGRDSNE